MVEAFIESGSRKSEKPQESRVNGKANGKANLTLFSHPTPLTLENLELALSTRYDNLEVKENTWKKSYYDISVHIGGDQTADEIKSFMFSLFGKSPLGGHLNHENAEKVHLFQYYKTENGIFHIGFYNISPPQK